MKVVKYLLLWSIFLLSSVSAAGQIDSWKAFSPLVSNRSEVERVIGRPRKVFEAFGIYQEGKHADFTVWYSDGKCDSPKDIEEYDVPAGILTQMYITFKVEAKLSDFEKDVTLLEKVKLPNDSDVVYLYSRDGSRVYKIFLERNGVETLLSVSLRPANDKKGLLCKSRR